MSNFKCAVCHDSLDPEHPLSLRQENPLTFRVAWMHYYCLCNALEQIADEPAKSPEYMDRLDEYNTKFGC